MRMLFMGRKNSAAKALEWTVLNGIEVVGVLTDNHLAGSKTKEVSDRFGIKVFTLEEVYKEIVKGTLSFDLAISYVYWRVIKEPLLSHPKLGVINFHPAPLPEYKGTAGYNMAILEGLNKWAITAHYIDAGIDTGEIIEKFEFSIDPDEETALSLERKSQEFILSLYKKTVRAVLNKGRLKSSQNSGGRYISRKEMEQLKKILPGDDIDRKIRAFWFPPYLGAFIEIEGKKYTLVNQQVLMSLANPSETHLMDPERR